MLKSIEKDVLPQVVNFYNSSKQLSAKGTGNDHALVLDLGGQMPALPIFPPKKEGEPAPKMLRLAAIDDVANRQVIGDSWTQMQASIRSALATFPLLAGQKMPEPEAKPQAGGLTTYAYSVMPGMEDLTPCASVNDQWLMLGTSVSQHADLAARLQKGKPATQPELMRWRLSIPTLREAMKTFSGVSPKPETEGQVKSAVKWLAPLGEIQGKSWIEAGSLRHSITLEAKDVLRYD